MLKHIFLGSAVCLLTMGVQAQEATPTRLQLVEVRTGWKCPEAVHGQDLNIYNWPLYIDSAVIEDFQVLCDNKVTVDSYATNEEMIARLRQGNPGYDIIIPTHFAIPLMAESDLLMPIDLEKIPNFEHVTEVLQAPEYDEDNTYTVPYLWGTLGIVYNTKHVEDAPESWNDFFQHDGPVGWFGDKRTMAGIALKMLDLDPNSVDADEITQARDYLIENGDNVAAITVGNAITLMSQGELDMVMDNNSVAYLLQQDCECDDYAYVIPEEGSYIWIDNLAIPVDAPHPEMAMAFMDYLLAPAVSAANANALALATPNQTAIDEGRIDESQLANPAIYPDAETNERLFLAELHLESEDLYAEAWDEVVIKLGQ
jgi:spermidine/putrescine transport system substrate-binding protein